MCGRFTLRTPASVVAEEFGLLELPTLTPRFNIAPTQQVATIRSTNGQRELSFMRWGLVPSWADDPSIGNRMLNARAETVVSKPSFRSAFKSRRCLVVADGFFEWRKEGKARKPFYITRSDGRPIAFAGLWERWQKGGEPLETCTVLTTTANELMEPLHDRMPVILSPEAREAWLADAQDLAMLAELLQPCPPQDLELYPVDPVVNNARNDVERCIERVSLF